MSKEIWIEAFDELIEKYLEEHEDATDEEAQAYAEKQIDQVYADNIGDMIDAARDRATYGEPK